MCFYVNLPLFERVQIRAANGVVLEDVQGYQSLERIQTLLTSKNELETENINGSIYLSPNVICKGNEPLHTPSSSAVTAVTPTIHSPIWGVSSPLARGK